ncbi:hypothetical protein LOTGIDRAFT_120296 [Lottia gigantea]|uniref:Choline transporter-like protein n=1 Tax=Lottia gigantea TaxID=225164 RepID=V4ACI4_LOTGI|nr:hypothetical protein LOTGIDRAFT_120296 [Lottia gigantea]ESO92820.1 hypothetical protein LOTGIDRAFT_120296 [Lottia gigantea]
MLPFDTTSLLLCQINTYLICNFSGEEKKFDPSFNGPIKNRSCTDVLCCLIFLIFVVGMVVCSALGYAHGDPTKLVYPTDSDGNLCGSGNFADKPNLMFFDLLDCAKMGAGVIVYGCPTPQVCVESCTTSYYVYLQTIALETANGGMITAERNKMLYNEQCAAYYVENTAVIGRCVPAIFNQITNLASNLVTNESYSLQNKDGTNYKEYGELVYKDIVTSWITLLIGLGGAVLLCLIWIVIMRWIAGIMVWFSIVAFLGLFGFSTYYSYSKYYELKTQNSTAEIGLSQAFALNFSYYLSLKQTWLAFGCGSATVLIILLLIIIFLCSRIRIAIELIKEASRAVGSMFSTLLFPIVPFIFQIAFLAYWVVSAAFVASMGSAEYKGEIQNTTSDGVNYVLERIPCTPNVCNNLLYYLLISKYLNFFRYTIFMQVYMLFVFLWVMNFIVALGQIVLAGAFASYYWAFNKPDDIAAFPLVASFWRAIRYHLGSIAFGAFIIAVIQMIRIVLEYLDAKLKGSENTIARFFLKCLKCCFWCLEKFMKFLNKNAYIMIAVRGKNFCASAKDAFFLIMRNIVRCVVLDKVADFLLFLSKLIVTAAICVGSYFWFQGSIPFFTNYVPKLNFYLTPVIVLTLSTYITASLFFSVYSMAVDTLFICFLEDLEMNDGSASKPYYMSKGLMGLLGKKNKTEKK